MTQYPHQRVRLVAATEPDAFDSSLRTSQDLIAYCARVSNPNNQKNLDTAEKLLRYCISKGHWSIFEMVSVVLEIETTRDIGRQILRHRSFSFQEFSQRYAKVDTSSFATREARLQDPKNRQNSLPMPDADIETDWKVIQAELQKHISTFYDWAIDNGIAKEQARAILPEGMTMSRMYMAGTLRSWIHYCKVRNDPGVTQAEHVDIAAKAWDILKAKYPFLEELQ